MSFNLLDLVKGQFNNDLVSKAASMFGENESGITKAISGIVPSVLSGIVSKGTSGNSGAAELLNTAKEISGGGLFSNLGGLLNNGDLLNKGGDLLKGILGDKANGIISTIAGFAGVKNSSVSSLMSLAAPAAMSTIGKHATENNLNASSFMDLLSSQKSSIMSALPGGLSSLAGTFGLGKVADVASSAGNTAKAAASQVQDIAQKKSGIGKLLPLLLLAGASLLAWWFLLGGKQGCNGNSSAASSDSTNVQTIDVVSDTAHTATTDEAQTTASTASESMMVKLPNGVEIDAFKGGIEDKIVAFLNNPDWAKLGEDSLKKVWYDFDKLNFETGKSVITAESQKQINNMVAILKAYPSAKIKIGGYTDKVGNEAGNKKISAARANAVKTALENAGVGAQVIGAEGYGSDFAKYPADAPEEDRVKDRHVSVSIRG